MSLKETKDNFDKSGFNDDLQDAVVAAPAVDEFERNVRLV
jgi:hypothetical protein